MTRFFYSDSDLRKMVTTKRCYFVGQPFGHEMDYSSQQGHDEEVFEIGSRKFTPKTGLDSDMGEDICNGGSLQYRLVQVLVIFRRWWWRISYNFFMNIILQHKLPALTEFQLVQMQILINMYSELPAR